LVEWISFTVNHNTLYTL